MKVLINQRFGVGDCVFIMSIAKKWMAEGHSITWPVLPQFVNQLQRAYPGIEWLDCNTVHCDYNRREEHDWQGYRVVPMAWANEIMGEPYTNCMRNKYDLLQLDYKDWKEGAMWNRNYVQEATLFDMWQTTEYNLVNRYFQSDGKGYVQIQPDNGLPNIGMRAIDGFSLFDWASVLQHATEIHTVSTSILFIIEMLDIRCPIHLYPRKPHEKDFSNVDYIFSKKYILHE